MNRVSGKVAIVTGAARGMGATFARRLVEEGAKVMLTDVLDAEGESTAQALGNNACFRHHDVTKEVDWQRIVSETEAAFGPVSVLVNNAGIVGFSPLETMDESDYRKVIDVNQVPVFLGMKSIVPSMKRAGVGSIINISSVAGLVGLPQMIGYTASKFAVRGMTKSAAIELAAYNIRVNSVHPAVIRTPMTTPSPGGEDVFAISAAQEPLGRVGQPDEVASIVLLLASDESGFSTGAEFIVDGGMSCK